MVDKDLFDAYSRAVATNSDLVRDAVLELGRRLHGLPSGEVPKALRAAYSALVRRYGGFAAALACDFYATQRQVAGVSGRYEPTVQGPDDGALLNFDVGEVLASSQDLDSAVAKLSRRAMRRVNAYADGTIQANAWSDAARPKWALVPHAGACAWCRMLGSGGFRYASERTAYDQRHDGCKCTSVVEFDTSNPCLEGYDPHALHDEYRKEHPEWAERYRWDDPR